MISRQNIFLLIVVLVLAFGAFFPCLFNGFTNWDDDAYVLRNLSVQSLHWRSVLQVFTSPVLGTYTPLSVLTHAMEYHFVGTRPFLYHWNNLLLYLGSIAIVFLLAGKLGLPAPAAFWAALIFGLHPMHVESVAWITERKDVLYGIFYLWALWAYLQYLEAGHRKYYLMTVAAGFLSILSKAMALSLPLILWLLDWLNGQKFFSRRFWEKIPFFLYILPVAGITYSLHARIPGRNVGEAALIWIWTFVFYIRKFFFPISLSPLYRLPQPVSLLQPFYAVSVLLFALILFLIVIWRKNKWFVFPFLYYLLSIFFCLRFDQKADASIVADRFMYLPCLGFCLSLGLGIETLGKKVRNLKPRLYPYLLLVPAGICLLLGIRTFRQCFVWKDSVSLWTSVVERYPQSARAYNNLGLEFLRRGETKHAAYYFGKALACREDFYTTFNNLGKLYLLEGDFDKASGYFRQALRVKPDSAVVYNNLGFTYLMQQNWDGAEAALIKAIELDPDLFEPRRNLARVFQAQNRSRDEERILREALKIAPADIEATNLLVDLYFLEKRVPEAVALGEAAMRTSQDAIGLLELGNTFLRNQIFPSAIGCYQKVIRLDDKNRSAYVTLGKVLGNFNYFDQAIAVWRQGLTHYPGDPEFLELIQKARELKGPQETNKRK